MGLAARGLPVKRLYVGEDRASRAYLGDQLVFADQELGVVGAPRVALAVRAHPPNVYPGAGAVVARIFMGAHAPEVRSSSTVLAVRAALLIAAHAPDIPKVVAPPAAAVTVAAPAPTYRQTTDLYVPAASVTVTAWPPTVGTAISAVAAALVLAAAAPTVSASAVVPVVVAAVVVSAPAPAFGVGAEAVTASVVVASPAPTVTASSAVSAVPAGITVQAGVPAVGTAVVAPVSAIAVTTPAPVASAGSSVAAITSSMSSAAHAPSVTADAVIPAVVAAITMVAPAPVVQTGVTLTDDFNRANGALGASWTAIGTAPTIVTNRAQAGTPGFNTTVFYAARHATPLTGDTQEVTFVPIAATANAAATVGGGAFLRCDSSGNRVEVAITNTQVIIGTRISGTATNRATASSTGTPSVRMTAVGNVYSAYLNGSGTPAVTWTDSGGLVSIGSGNRYVGIVTAAIDSFGSVSRGWSIDSWTAADI